MRGHRLFCRVVPTAVVGAALIAAAAAANDQPRPRPTPAPRTLAAVAGKISLDRGHLASEGESLVISDHNLGELASQGRLTVAGATAAEPRTPLEPAADRREVEKEREHWRGLYRKQVESIAKLEERRQLLLVDVDQLEGRRQTPSTVLRLEKTEKRLELLEHRIAEERTQLDRIVDQARRHGAQPGWFRGLD